MATSTGTNVDTKALGTLLRQLRLAAGMSLEDVADKADIQLWIVAQYEAGDRHDLNHDELDDIARCYPFTAERVLAAVGADSENLS